jgi:hypothetical protein
MALSQPAFMSSDGFHKADDGISMLKWRIFDALKLAICQQRNFVAPHVRDSLASGQVSPFAAYFDVGWLGLKLYQRFGVGIVSPNCASRYVLTRVPPRGECATAANESMSLTDVPVADAGKTNWNRLESEEIELKKILIQHMVPALAMRHRLRTIVRQSLASRFICLHLRTEDDFKAYFKIPPGYYSNEQVASKLARMRNESPQFADIDVLYISGDHANIGILRKIFGMFSTVHTKSTLLNETDVPYYRLALIDKEICQSADVFIGNNHSAWSEFVAFYRMLSNSSLANFQYNAVAPREPLDAPLSQFCAGPHHMKSLFGTTCRYYRRI